MEKLKLGIIGAGYAFEQLHLPNLQRLSDKFEIKAICDRNAEKAKKAAEKLGLGTDGIFTDYEDMLENVDIEAVDLMVPIQENFEVAKSVINAKKHLIAEKPFAATVKGAKELIKLANTKDVKVLVAENFRYAEENKIIQNIIETKRIGNVVYFIDVNNKEFQKEMLEDNFSATEWRQHPDFKGGIFLDSGVHNIARMRFLFGDVDKIFATGRPSEVDFCP